MVEENLCVGVLPRQTQGPTSSSSATTTRGGFSVVGQSTERSFQFRMALNAKAKLPCVSQRQNGRIANSTTCPRPSGTSTTAGRPASSSPATSSPDSRNESRLAWTENTTRGRLRFTSRVSVLSWSSGASLVVSTWKRGDWLKYTASVSGYPYAIGLAGSRLTARYTPPVARSDRAGAMSTPRVSPYAVKTELVPPSVSTTPPERTQSPSAAMPSSPMPGRTSSVESSPPRFGVSGLRRQGTLGPTSGSPLTISWAFSVTYGSTSTSNRRSCTRSLSCCTLRYAYGMCSASNA